MNHRVIGGGAIVCSAVVFYGWMQPFTTKAGLPSCQDAPVNSNASTTAEAVSPPQQANCSQPITIPFVGHLPELPSFNFQLSGFRSHNLLGQMEATYADMIQKAQELADRNQFAEAMAQITGIPKNSRHYATAQQLQDNWSRELLQRATKSYQAADVVTAIETLNTIPQTCPQFNQANDLRQRWHQQTIKLEQAFAAKDAGDWQGVINAIQSLEGTQLYSTSPVQELLQYAMIQQFAPDADLMQFVTANVTEPTSAAAPIRPFETIPSELPLSSVEPLPNSYDAAINLNQALEWVQPPAYVALKPAKTSQQKSSNNDMPVIDGSPSKSPIVSSYSSPVM